MKVLLIGYGSIGKRHEEVLTTFQSIKAIHIVTRQPLPNKTTFKNLQDVNDLDTYDYILIASETYKHFEQLAYLEEHVAGKLVFCEKPLFDGSKTLPIVHNTVFIGYVLRFHPLLQKLKSLVENERVIHCDISCGQYLPTWRDGTDYRTSYSANKEYGGGVLLDLSHEIDYTQWLFGKMTDIQSYQGKVSDLEITSDDLVTLISNTDKGVRISLSIDYISKIPHRRMRVNTMENTYELDFIKNVLTLKSKTGSEQNYQTAVLERNSMFKEMHTSILSDHDSVCTYNEAQDVMQTISIIQEQNL